MVTIAPIFNILGVQKVVSNFVDEKKNKQLEALIYIGNEFIKKARTNKTYHDRTGNLRSSIGYLIYENGKILFEDFKLSKEGTDRETGLSVGIEFGKKFVKDNEIALIGVAGMNYAFFVEKKGLDVITGSAPTKNDLLDLLS